MRRSPHEKNGMELRVSSWESIGDFERSSLVAKHAHRTTQTDNYEKWSVWSREKWSWMSCLKDRPQQTCCGEEVCQETIAKTQAIPKQYVRKIRMTRAQTRTNHNAGERVGDGQVLLTDEGMIGKTHRLRHLLVLFVIIVHLEVEFVFRHRQRSIDGSSWRHQTTLGCKRHNTCNNVTQFKIS